MHWLSAEAQHLLVMIILARNSTLVGVGLSLAAAVVLAAMEMLFFACWRAGDIRLSGLMLFELEVCGFLTSVALEANVFMGIGPEDAAKILVPLLAVLGGSYFVARRAGWSHADSKTPRMRRARRANRAEHAEAASSVGAFDSVAARGAGAKILSISTPLDRAKRQRTREP
jgi:hypothetical protein